MHHGLNISFLRCGSMILPSKVICGFDFHSKVYAVRQYLLITTKTIFQDISSRKKQLTATGSKAPSCDFLTPLRVLSFLWISNSAAALFRSHSIKEWWVCLRKTYIWLLFEKEMLVWTNLAKDKYKKASFVISVKYLMDLAGCLQMSTKHLSTHSILVFFTEQSKLDYRSAVYSTKEDSKSFVWMFKAQTWHKKMICM